MPRDAGPMARLDVVKANPLAAEEIFEMLCDGKTLAQVAKTYVKGGYLPKGKFIDWYTTEHAERYERALKVVTEDIAHGVKDLLYTVTPKNYAAVKVKVDGLLKLMAKWNRPRYGETVRVEKSVTVGVDAGLLGTAGELLRLMAKKEPRVIEQEPVHLPAPQDAI